MLFSLYLVASQERMTLNHLRGLYITTRTDKKSFNLAWIKAYTKGIHQRHLLAYSAFVITTLMRYNG